MPQKIGTTAYFKRPVTGSYYGKQRTFPQAAEYQAATVGKGGLTDLSALGAPITREQYVSGIQAEIAQSKKAGKEQPSLTKLLTEAQAGAGITEPGYVAPGFERGGMGAEPTPYDIALKKRLQTEKAQPLASLVTPPGEKFWTGSEFLTDPGKIAQWKVAHPGGFDPLAMSRGEVTPPTPQLGAELPFPTTQAQMAEYQEKYTFTGGKWREKAAPTAPTAPPTGAPPTAAPTPTAPTAPTPAETPTAAPTAPETQMGQLTQNWQKMFEDFTAKLTETQQATETKYAETLKGMETTATAEAQAGMKAMQESVKGAFEQYRQDFETAYQQIAQQGQTAIEALSTFREQQGLPQMEQQLAGIDRTILDVEGLLTNLQEDIRTRTEGMPVTEAAGRRLTAMEGAPLEKRLTELIRGRARVAAGLEAKQATVEQFMGAQEADVARQERLAEMRLGLAETRFGVEADLATTTQTIMTNLQTRLFDISKLQLGAIENEGQYRQELLKAGFDFASTMMAEQRADIRDKEKFERELLKEQYKSDLKALNPEVQTVDDFTDKAGNVTMVTTYKDGSQDVTTLPGVGKVQEVGEGTEGLTASQVTAGNTLAKQLYGSSAIRTKDGYNNFVRPIMDRMRAGENIDTIADDLRFRGQSVAFTGTIREAAQQITAELSAGRTQTVFDKLDDVIDTGDTGKVRDFLKRMAIDNAAGGAEQAKMIMGQERTVEFLDEIYQDLQDFEAKGGDTNIFAGTIEAAAAKAGTVKDAELRRIATKITKARQQYRRSMTGVAFSPGESREYDAMFPAINRTMDFNTATVEGLREAFRGDVDFFYGFAMGQDAYQELFKGDVGGEQETRTYQGRTYIKIEGGWQLQE